MRCVPSPPQSPRTPTYAELGDGEADEPKREPPPWHTQLWLEVGFTLLVAFLLVSKAFVGPSAGVLWSVRGTAVALLVKVILLDRFARWQFLPVLPALALLEAPGLWIHAAWPLLLIALCFVLGVPQPPELPAVTGKWSVGCIRAHLAVDGEEVLVSVYYPCVPGKRSKTRLFSPQGVRYCGALASLGGSWPFNTFPFRFIMQHLRLVHSPVSPEAPFADPPAGELFPAAVFSHGLNGSPELYVCVCSDVASRGWVVFSVEHTDRSGALARFPDGSVVRHSFAEDLLSYPEDFFARRVQVDKRAAEFITAARCARSLCGSGTDVGPCTDGAHGRRGQAAELKLALDGRVDAREIAFLGHSMGGATALLAAACCPDPVFACAVLDPAIDWLPAPLREELVLPADRAKLLTPDAPGYAPPPDLRQRRQFSEVPLQVLYSGEWFDSKPGRPKGVLRTFQEKGKMHRESEYILLLGVTHFGMSDLPALLPPRICRALGFTAETSTGVSCALIRAEMGRFVQAARARRVAAGLV